MLLALVNGLLLPTWRSIDRTRKLRIYAAAGVAHAWLIDPVDRTLEALVLQGGAWTIAGIWTDSDVVRLRPFEAIELQLARLWADTAPPAAPPAG